MGKARPASPTVSEVAEAAGVGRATAARTLGGYGYVSEVMRERVLTAAEQLGYRANQLARSVSTGVSHTIGVVVADIANPFFGGVVGGISEVASAQGYDALVISTYEHLSEEVTAMNVLVDKRVDGIILASAATDQVSAAHLRVAQDQGIPVVLLDRLIPGVHLDAVVIENRSAARAATASLVAAGHTRIGFVWGPLMKGRPRFRRELAEATTQNVWTDGERLLGYFDALDDAGLPVDPDLVTIGEKVERRAYTEVTRMLALPEPPTALFCTETEALTGTLLALRDAGRSIPNDVSVIGFDDSSWATVMTPPLTMIEQPLLTLGRRVAEQLLAHLGHEASPESAAPLLELPTRLVERESVAPPPRD